MFAALLHGLLGEEIIKMFTGNDGELSSTKFMSFVGYVLFVFISVYVCIYNPTKFNYELFAILTASTSSGLRALDKWMNVRSYTRRGEGE